MRDEQEKVFRDEREDDDEVLEGVQIGVEKKTSSMFLILAV